MIKKTLCASLLLSCFTEVFCITTQAESQQYHILNLTGDHNMAASSDEMDLYKSPSEQPHFIQSPSEYLTNLQSLFAHNRPPSHFMNNPHHSASESQEVPNIRLLGLNLPYHHQDQPYHEYQDQFGPIKKHDNQNFGWDSFNNNNNNQGFNINSGGGHFGIGAAGALGGALKKGKDAKALFVLMAPLVLLAAFGPLLATQAMLPWVTNGGLTTVTTMAGGKRRRRQVRVDPKTAAELESRLRLFMEVQDFIARTGAKDFVQEMGEAFLQCQKYSEKKNKCLERVACEYMDDASYMDPQERRIGRMVLRNVVSNPSIPVPLINRLKKGFRHAKNRPGQCAVFWCGTVDNPVQQKGY